MRDFIVLAIILGATPICIFRPYFGLLMWTWVGYFNPHRFTWGAAYNFPVALVIGGATLAGLPFAKDTNRRILTFQTILILSLWAWFGVTTMHAASDPVLVHHVEYTKLELMRISKILLMTVLMIWLVSSRDKFRYLFLVTAFSFGIIAIKGALFGWITSGQFRVYGPPDSFIEDNNALGLAFNMMLPVFYYMARTEPKKWMQWFLHTSFYCTILASILTYSRGALLGLGVVLIALALKSRHKVLAGFLLVACAWSVITFAPGRWMDRMGDFFHGNLDNSAELRLNAWRFSYELAKHYPITGGGLQTFTPQLYQRYTPELQYAGPHSIYFQTLGEHGFGQAGHLSSSAWFLSGQSHEAPKTGAVFAINRVDRTLYGHATISLLAYMISGAFLELAYFDLFYQVVASVILLKILYRNELELASRNIVEATIQIPTAEVVEA